MKRPTDNLANQEEFCKWRRVYFTTHGKEKDVAFQKMQEVELSFNEWLWFRIWAENRGIILLTVRKMKKSAKTLKEWKTVLNCSWGDTFVEATDAIKKIPAAEATFEEWKELYDISRSDLKEIVFRKMETFDFPFERWKKIFMYASDRTRILALRGMMEKATTFNEWKYIYKKSLGNTRKIAWNEIEKLNTIAQKIP